MRRNKPPALGVTAVTSSLLAHFDHVVQVQDDTPPAVNTLLSQACLRLECHAWHQPAEFAQVVAAVVTKSDKKPQWRRLQKCSSVRVLASPLPPLDTLDTLFSNPSTP